MLVRCFFPGLLGQDWGTDLVFSLESLGLLSVLALGETSICLSVFRLLVTSAPCSGDVGRSALSEFRSEGQGSTGPKLQSQVG